MKRFFTETINFLSGKLLLFAERLKFFQGLGGGRFMKKPEYKKSRDTVPLNHEERVLVYFLTLSLAARAWKKLPIT
jgi:hypothetical protein